MKLNISNRHLITAAAERRVLDVEHQNDIRRARSYSPNVRTLDCSASSAECLQRSLALGTEPVRTSSQQRPAMVAATKAGTPRRYLKQFLTGDAA